MRGMNTQPLTFKAFFQGLSAEEKSAFAQALNVQKIWLFQIMVGGKYRPSGQIARAIEEQAKALHGKWVPKELMRADIFGPLPESAHKEAA